MSTTINITETAVNVVVTEETINIEASGGQGPVGVGVPAGGTAGQILAKINSTNYNTQWINNTDLVGLTSVGVSMPAAFSVANSPLTANGTIAVTGAGNALQYINGLGNLVTFPTLTGFVTSVTGTSPIASSGGTTPAISIAQATTSVSGFLSSTDWNTFNGKQNALTNPVTGTGTTNTLPKFTGASTIGNSNITDTGTAIALNSDTAIGTTTLAAATKLTLGGSETAVSAIARGGLINSTLVASANGDVLVGLDINPTYTLGAFTGTQSLGIRSTALITTNLAGGFYGGFVANSNRLGNNNYSFTSHSPSSGVANQIYSGSRPATPTTNAVSHYVGTDTQVYWDTTNAPYNFLISGTQYLKLFNTTGNFTLQNGGTFTDAGFRLDVTGTSRFNGQTTITGSTTAASALARGIIATPTLVAAANNDVLVGLEINPTFTNGAFTGVTNLGLRVNGTIAATGALTLNRNTSSTIIYADTSETTIINPSFTARLAFRIGTTDYGRFFPTTGNFTLQNGGTFTDIASARLAVNSTTQGFLPPRMTTTEKNAISSPATGLVVFDTTLGKLCVFATTWQTITSV